MIFHKFLFAVVIVFAASHAVRSEQFENLLLVNNSRPCEVGNIDTTRFSSELKASAKVDICSGMGLIVKRLNNNVWSEDLKSELIGIWKVFGDQDVFFSPMPQNADSSALAVTQSFPPGKARDKFSSTIYLKSGIENQNYFYHVVFHELRHVFDFYELWASGTDISPIEIERRAFRLMSLIDEETPKSDRFSKIPSLWDDTWKELDSISREEKREEAIFDLLTRSGFYKTLSPIAEILNQTQK